jgi:hypothetical protein
MPDDARVDELLKELLDSGATPEEVCRTCPELLAPVRTRWQQVRALQAEVAALFPESPSVDDANPNGVNPHAPPRPDLPHIPGYEIQDLLGHGGMGVVYKAWHLRLNRAVALKMLLASPYARPQELERFLREAEAVASLRHANVVQVYDMGNVDGRPYFTMELVEGGSLAQKLTGTPQPARQAAALVASVAEAVYAAHQRRSRIAAELIVVGTGLCYSGRSLLVGPKPSPPSHCRRDALPIELRIPPYRMPRESMRLQVTADKARQIAKCFIDRIHFDIGRIPQKVGK